MPTLKTLRLKEVKMKLDIKKIFGYFLVFTGLICMAFALYCVYNVFTNMTKPPEIFKLNNLVFFVNPGRDRVPTEVTVRLEPEARKIVDTFLYYLFMLFILALGSKVSMLGTQFIREVKGL